jgi:hypothetical protein
MMKSEQYTDALFKELDQLEVQPSGQVWVNIESRLGPKKRKLVPVFWRWGIAASILLLAGLFLLVPGDDLDQIVQLSPSTNNSENPERLQSEIASVETESHNDDTSESNADNQHDMPVDAIDGKVGNIVEETDGSLLMASQSVDESERVVVSTSLQKENVEVPKKIKSLAFAGIADVPVQPGVIVVSGELSTLEYFGLNLPSEKASDKSSVGIVLGGEYSPTYAYRDVSGAAASGMNESGVMTSGGGFNVAVKMSSRWQIETGVKYAMLGQEVTPPTESRMVYGAADFSAESSVTLQEVKLNNSLGVIERDVSPALNSDVREFQSGSNALMEMKSETSYSSEAVVLEQNLSYLQVPFTLRYQLLRQGPVHLSLAGGVGANWLLDNTAYLEMSGQRQNVGRTGGVSDLSFSTHAGVAVSVPLYRGLGIRMEPRFNYFLSDISREAPGKFRPYSFGVFTGLFYEFGK